MRIKLSSSKIIGTSPHLNVPSKRMTSTVVYSRLFAKHFLLSRGNHSGLTLSGQPRDEMASDLLTLAPALRTDNNLLKDFQWMADCLHASDNRESSKKQLDKEVENAGLAYRQPPMMATVCFMQCMTSSEEYECHKTTLLPGELSQK